MKRAISLVLHLAIFALLLGSATAAFGQEQKPNIGDASCDGVDLEREHYTVRSSKISDPFDFLPWIKVRERRAAAKISALIDGKPFLYKQVNDGGFKIIEEENFLPDTTETRVKLRLLVIRVSNCSDQKVDVVYGVYSTQVMPVLSGSPESRLQDRLEPENSAGLVNVDVPESRPYRFTPLFGYDSADKLGGGGRFEFERKRNTGPVSAGIVEALVSSQMHQVRARLNGYADDWKWLAHLEWNLQFDNFRLPTNNGKLSGASLSAHLAGTSRPLGRSAIVIRFGGLVEGGNRQSDLVNPRLTPDTLASAPYGSVKLFIGTTSRSRHNAVSASYGLQLGATGRAVRVDWAKHIADIRHEFWYPIGNHRTLDLESRLNFGKIATYGKIPLAERFFGGNDEQDFIALDSWQVRASPVIRAIPGSTFFRTSTGDGGDKFFSYNLTAAFAVWRRPLVPFELSQDKEFHTILEGQLVSSEEFVKLYFMTKDPHFAKAAEFLKKPDGASQLKTALASLSAAVSTAQTNHVGQHADEFRACLSSLRQATSRATNGEAANGEKLYSYVASLLSADEDLLTEVKARCVETLNGSGVLNGDPAIKTAGESVERIRSAMESEFGAIDESGAANRAKADMTFTRSTISTLLNDVNLYSVSPVFIFDIARLEAKKRGFGGLRYGPGGGLRLELVNSVNFTGGYAWNPRRGPGEAKGTFFFSMGVRDLFR
jgi:hypothetical protein